MNNNDVLNEFFVWEENNSTDLNQNSLKSAEQDKCVTTTETKTNVENLHWKDITDPKLRKKMRDKAYYNENRCKILIRHKNYYELNKDKKKVQSKVNRDKRKSHDKAYREANKDKRKIQSKIYREANRDKILAQKKSYRESNKYKISVINKTYYESNKDKVKQYKNNRLKKDIQYKLSERLRKRLNGALNGNYKNGSAVKDLGCTIPELKIYLESKFQSGMNWNNHSLYGWHIDHIKPLSSFDLTDRKQFLEACHYTNLQPLWANDNLIKSDKIIPQAV